MSTEDNFTNKLPRFGGKGFGLWKRQVEVVMKTKGLWKAVKPGTEAVAETQDLQSQAILFGALEQAVIQKVVSCSSAAEIWDRLHQIYENKSPANKGRIFEQFYSYRKEDSDEMSTHVSKVEALALQLEEVGEKQSEASIMSRLLHSLPAQYEALKEAWDSVDVASQTRSNLISRLLSCNVIESSSSNTQDMALITRAEADKYRGGNKKRVRCYGCGKLGHYKSECKEGAVQATRSGGGPNIALVLNRGAKNDQWIVDSGSSRHTCCRKEWFTTFKVCSEKLQVGNEEWVEAVGRGSVHLRCQLEGGHEDIELRDVLYIPSMAFNLFSTGKSAERGAITTLGHRGARITMNGKLIALGDRDETTGLSVLRAKVRKDVIMLVTTRRTLTDWHQSFGHVDPQVIREMAQNHCVEGIEIVQDQEPRCSFCPLGKATRAPHQLSTSLVPKEVGDQVDIDLVGPVPESIKGSKYMMLAKDRFSGYIGLCALKTKAQVCEGLQKYVGEFEALSGKRIKSILTDNGSEFNNTAVKTLMAVEHIGMRFSSPYTPEQNGAAERNNRTIIEAIRTMLTQAKLPEKLWAEAAYTATYLRNRVTRRGARQTPFELFYGRKPFVGHIVPFGTPVQALINDRRLGKFEPKTQPAYIVGFTDRSNTYRIYLPNENKVKQSCDVIFRDHTNFDISQGDEHAQTYFEVTSRSQNVLDSFFDGILHAQSGASNVEEHESSQADIGDHGQGAHIEGEQAAHVEGEQESENFESPSFSTITNLSNSRGNEERSSLANPETPKNRSKSSIEYPDLSEENMPSPFQGNTLPRTPPRPTQRGPTILLSYETVEPLNQEPSTYKDAIEGPNNSKWRQAIAAELLAHSRNKTWSIVQRPRGGTLLSAKWIFTHKRDAAGNIERYKARLVARGFQQVAGINYDETFAPVARIESIRILLAIAAAKNLSFERFDVSTAFLNGTLEEEILMEPPSGVDVDENYCLKLNKALYGLKQAPKVWNSYFNKIITSFGFEATISDPCVYVNKSQKLLLAVYVDDGILIGESSAACVSVINALNQIFATTRITGDVFLGMQIANCSDGLHLSQSRYVDDVLKTFNMADGAPVDIPLVDTKILFEQEDKEDARVPYRAAIGCLLYTAMCTRPDILFATTLLARFCEHPKQVHWAAIKRVLRYLKGSRNHGVYYRKAADGPLTIEAYCDADWAGELEGRKSTTGLVIKLSGGPVIYASRRQSAVAQSSSEAEFYAACDAAKELSWLTAFLQELEVAHEKPKLLIDNRSTISQIKNHDVKRRSKHIEIKYHYVRQKHIEGLFSLEHVSSDCQLADFLTKRLSAGQHRELLNRANIFELKYKTEKEVSARDRGGVLGLAIAHTPKIVRRLCGL